MAGIAFALLACTIQPAKDSETTETDRPADFAAATKIKKPQPPAKAESEAAEKDPLVRRAADGDAAAQFDLAGELAEGRGRTRDHPAALKWFTAAAEQNHADAQYHLAAMLSRGIGGEKDLKAANRWYRRAADQGHPGAQYNLGVAYATGDRRDYVEARTWFEMAAGRGVAKAHYNLAQIYEHGAGTAADPVKAYTHYAVAARQGVSAAADRMDTLRRSMTSGEVAAAESALAAEPDDSAADDMPSSAPLTAPALLGRRQSAGDDASEAAEAPAAPRSEGYGVQFGAFKQQETADELWRQLVAKHGDLLDGQRQSVVPLTHANSDAKLFALRTGPFAGRDSAGKLCRQLQDREVECIVVSL